MIQATLLLVSFLLVQLILYFDLGVGKWLSDILNALFTSTVMLFLICWLKDPGYLVKSEELNFQTVIELASNLQENFRRVICSECELIRTYRSRHCQVCSRCVDKFDHHCPWINNCVGSGNFLLFYVYLISTLLFLLSLILVSIWTIVLAAKSDQYSL